MPVLLGYLERQTQEQAAATALRTPEATLLNLYLPTSSTTNESGSMARRL